MKLLTVLLHLMASLPFYVKESLVNNCSLHQHQHNAYFIYIKSMFQPYSPMNQQNEINQLLELSFQLEVPLRNITSLQISQVMVLT